MLNIFYIPIEKSWLAKVFFIHFNNFFSVIFIEQAEDFNREWTQKSRPSSSQPAINYPHTDRYDGGRRPRPLLALPSPAM